MSLIEKAVCKYCSGERVKCKICIKYILESDVAQAITELNGFIIEELDISRNCQLCGVRSTIFFSNFEFRGCRKCAMSKVFGDGWNK